MFSCIKKLKCQSLHESIKDFFRKHFENLDIRQKGLELLFFFLKIRVNQKLILMSINGEEFSLRWAYNIFRCKLLSTNEISFKKSLFLIKGLSWLNDNKLFLSKILLCFYVNFFSELKHQLNRMVFEKLVLS